MRLPLLPLLLLFAACAPLNTPGDAMALAGTSWTLTAISGRPPVAGSNVTLQFAGATASGSAGCNQYHGPYTRTASTLTFGAMAATRRACVEAERNTQETAYLDALTRVASYTASPDRLVLQDAAGATLLEFKSAIRASNGAQ